MLNATEIGNEILNGLFAHYGDRLISFNGEVHLGLLTVLPNPNGAVYGDGTYFKELSSPDYQRVRLDTTSRITGKYIMADATSDPPQADENGDMYCVSRIRNQALLIFPEVTVPETVVGFGLFRHSEKDNYTLPFLWGSVLGENGEPEIRIEAEEIPVIREGGIEIAFA